MDRVISKGFLLKDIIKYNEKSISFIHSSLQFPFSFISLKWRGFVRHEEHTYEFDERIHYFINQGKILKRQTLYLSHSGEYESLPTNEEDMANDDMDDLALEKYNARDSFNNAKTDIKDLGDDYDADLYLKTETIQLRIGKYTKELYGLLEASSAQKAEYFKVGSILNLNQQCLAYDDTWAFHVKPKFISDSEIDTTPIIYMAFFLRTKPIFSKGGLYCGYHRQIFIKHVNADTLNKFHIWCKTHAPRLNESGLNFSSSVLANPLNIFRWIYPDNISITDKALLFTKKTFRKDEMIYLPYERINFLLSKRGIFFKRFDIFGEQNILPKYSFSKSDYNQIKEEIKRKGVETIYGRTYHSTYLYPKNWFGQAPRIIISNNQILYYPNRLKREIEEYKTNQRHTLIDVNDIYNVTWYKTLFTWIGDIEIVGMPSNIRRDQNNKMATIIIPNLWMFNYHFFLFFSGSLKRWLRQGGSINFVREFKSSWKTKNENKEDNNIIKLFKSFVAKK